MLVSPKIGAKVLLNNISAVFKFPPTKVRAFTAFKDDKNEVHADEIQVKGVCNKKLEDYGIKEDSKIFIFQNEDDSGGDIFPDKYFTYMARELKGSPSNTQDFKQ